MKRSLLAIAIAIAIANGLGCGGSTTAFSVDPSDSGSDTAAHGGAAGAGADASGTSEAAGGAAGTVASADASTGGRVDSSAPNPRIIDGCSSLCTKEASANCPNQGTLASCNVGCRLILNDAMCTPAADALFACEKNSGAACDSDGKATLTSCGVEQLSAAACFLQRAQDPSLASTCMAYCAKMSAANCPNDDPAGCATNCAIAGNVFPACSSAWKANVTCGATAAFACGSDGKASAAACNLQAASFLLCALNGVAGLVDGGQ